MILEILFIASLTNLVSLSNIEKTKHVEEDKTMMGDQCNPFHHCESNMIPIELAEAINEFEDIDAFNEIVDDPTVSVSRFNRSRRAASEQPRPATCVPMPTVVNLRPSEDKDPLTVYFPSCTVMQRCGGCCTHKLLSCQPVEEEMKSFSISKSQYVSGSKKLQSLGKVTVTIPEHKKCQCKCVQTEKDCNKLQVYIPQSCQCSCKNKDDQDSCTKQSSIKIWDNNSCTCLCREQKECSTGYHFDSESCSCVESSDFEAHYDNYDEFKYDIEN